MKFKQALRNIGLIMHSIFSFSPNLAKCYLVLWSLILRQVPPSKIKDRLVNSLRSVNWPNLDLKPQNVALGSAVNVKITPHSHEFDFDALFFKRLSYEHNVFIAIEERAKFYDSVIEIGANVGIYTVFFAKLFEALNPNIKVFAFEPSFEAFYRLQQNIRVNLVKNVHLFNCGIGDQTGFTQFYEPDGHLTNGSLYPDFASIFSKNLNQKDIFVINAIELTQLVKGYRKVLVKIDVEGAENIVLESMKTFITVEKPDIIIEVLEFQENKLNTLEFLLEAYDLFNITPHGLIPQIKFSATQYRDYFLIPK